MAMALMSGEFAEHVHELVDVLLPAQTIVEKVVLSSLHESVGV